MTQQEQTTFKVGDRVRFNAKHKDIVPSLHDEVVRRVEAITPVPLRSRRTALHHQWMALEGYSQNHLVSGALLELVN